MKQDESKQHFAEICETIWHKIESQQKLDRATAEGMRQVVANMAMMAWNMCLIHNSLSETQKDLRKFAADNYDSDPCALIPLMDAAELKWHDFRGDHGFIARAEVKTVAGKPQVFAYLKGECPEVTAATGAFQDFMNSPAIQERLKHTTPEKLEEEIGKIVAEYNASLPSRSPQTTDDADEEDDERTFPISAAELDFASGFTKNKVTREDKRQILDTILEAQPFLAPLCENAYKKKTGSDNAIPDMILTAASVYIPDTDLIACDQTLYRDLLKGAKMLASEFISDRQEFYNELRSFEEPHLFSFFAESLAGLKFSPKELKEKMSILFVWAFMIERARVAQHPDKYDDDE